MYVLYLLDSNRFAKNQYGHLKYLKLSDSFDSKFNYNEDILIGADYYLDFVSGNIKRGNSGPRMRIVYDASAKRDCPSLNTLPQIIDILLRF